MNQILESATVFKIIAFPRKDSGLYLRLFSLATSLVTTTLQL